MNSSAKPTGASGLGANLRARHHRHICGNTALGGHQPGSAGKNSWA